MPPVDPVAQELEHKKRELSLAKWAIISTVVVALTGAFVTWQVSNAQIDSNNTQSTTEFERSEQRVSYGDFLAAITTLEDVEESQTLRSTDEVPNPPGRASADEWDDALNELDKAFSSVELVGSEQSVDWAHDIRGWHTSQRYNFDVLYWKDVATDLVGNPEAWSSSLEYDYENNFPLTGTVSEIAASLRQKYLDAAREDLGSS